MPNYLAEQPWQMFFVYFHDYFSDNFDLSNTKSPVSPNVEDYFNAMIANDDTVLSYVLTNSYQFGLYTDAPTKDYHQHGCNFVLIYHYR